MRGMMYDVNISNPVWKVVEPLAHEKLKVVMNHLTYYIIDSDKPDYQKIDFLYERIMQN